MFGNRAIGHFAQIKRTAFGKAASLLMSVFLLIIAGPVFAQSINEVSDGAQTFAANAGLVSGDLATVVGRVIYAFLGLLGIIAVVLIVYAGYLWTTSAGDETKVTRAKDTLKNAIIGLVLILSSWAIVAFILNTIGDATSGISGSNPLTPFSRLFNGTRGQDALGNGIIQYHYPEPDQKDVPRGTKLAITFKKPLVLSSIIKNYDDNKTFTTADDKLCPTTATCFTDANIKFLKDIPVIDRPNFEVSPDALRLIANSDLGSAGSGDADAQFDSRQPIAKSVSAMKATATFMQDLFDETKQQTIVLRPATGLGSASENVNYRVALRGGGKGIKVWVASQADGSPEAKIAFDNQYSDGAYYWSFTTSTVFDNTPPKLVAVEPDAYPIVSLPKIFRNQVLQAYFDESVDPTTASGVIGDGGFTNIAVNAECLAGQPCEFNSTSSPSGANATLKGTLNIGNRFRTIEFLPSDLCEGITENSCGDKVYCLPKNIKIDLHIRAANVADKAPQASDDNGVEDMSGNSFDGNNDGLGQGPKSIGRPLEYSLNALPASNALDQVSDTTVVEYKVGSDIDLTPPRIIDLKPPSPPEVTAEFPNGPSKIATDLQPSVTFSKTMRVDSMVTGGYKEFRTPGTGGEYTISASTLVLRSSDCAKDSVEACPVVGEGVPTTCPCTLLEPPAFFPNVYAPFDAQVGGDTVRVSKVEFKHSRLFYTANDLGYTEADILKYPRNIPIYAPIVRAKIQDTRQNCFYPSVYRPSDGTQCRPGTGGTEKSCCDTFAINDGINGINFLGACGPSAPSTTAPR